MGCNSKRKLHRFNIKTHIQKLSGKNLHLLFVGCLESTIVTYFNKNGVKIHKAAFIIHKKYLV